ncbi:MAG: hypothetical protein ACRDYV_02530 [Acidimicrobiia bacterium]
MRWASGALVALLVVGQGGAGSAPEEAEPAQVAEFIAAPGARTGCVKLDVPEASGVACFDVQVTTGTDPTTDEFVWRLRAWATATEGRRLERLKVRLSGGRESLSTWEPRGPRVLDGAPVTAGLPATPAPVRFQPPVGRLVTYADDDLYHVSWARTAASGKSCCRQAEIGGVTGWTVGRGTGMRAQVRIEAWVR